MATVVTLQRKYIFLYGTLLAAVLILLQTLQVHCFYDNKFIDTYTGSIALLFTALGIWLTKKLSPPKTIVVEREVYIEIPATMPQTEIMGTRSHPVLSNSGISNRELEVLQLMAAGLSNQEIAERLFVSQNTVKTHSSNLYLKLDVKRRTQAIEKARNMGIIPQ